jgi:hypothetical protein
MEVMRWDSARPADRGSFGDFEASGHGRLTFLYMICGLPEANPVNRLGISDVQLWTAEARVEIVTTG